MNRSSWPYPNRQSDHHPRGTKRTRSDSKENPSDQSDQTTEEDDVDVPLSKKINRLNIEYSQQNDDQVPQNFQEKYPYNSNTAYYKPNELLYNLHEERTQRNQQATLRKALNSHLKL